MRSSLLTSAEIQDRVAIGSVKVIFAEDLAEKAHKSFKLLTREDEADDLGDHVRVRVDRRLLEPAVGHFAGSKKDHWTAMHFVYNALSLVDAG